MRDRHRDLMGKMGAVICLRDRRRHGRFVLAVAAALAALCGPALLRPAPFLVWNASASMPIGLYRVTPAKPIRRGDLVLASLPEPARSLAAERHYLPAGVPIVKRVAAVAGSRVCAVGSNVSIEGRLIAHQRDRDGNGRPLPRWIGCRTLAPDEVFLLIADRPDSFDGRYFGPTEKRQIVGRLVPLWTR